MKLKTILLCTLILLSGLLLKSQNLPHYKKSKVAIQKDWLIDNPNAKAKLYEANDGKIVLSNGLVSRTFTIIPNGATVGLDLLSTNESFLRSVRPEAEIEIDGLKFNVGGLTGQPIHNYLLPEWLKNMTADPASFKLQDFKIEDTKVRFPWKKRLEWMPVDLPWPPPGKELIFTYQLDEEAIRFMLFNEMDENNRNLILEENFEQFNDQYKTYESNADNRNSFMNEGKMAEIMALANTAVFADLKAPDGAIVFYTKINPGTDNSVSWGPGLGLVLNDRVVKINLRTKENKFGFYDGEKEILSDGMKPGKAVWLRFEIKNDKLISSFSYDEKKWHASGSTHLQNTEKVQFIRLGKMDWSGGSSDHGDKGEQGRCHVESLKVLGSRLSDVKTEDIAQYSWLKDIQVKVHYELYDNMPVFCKWITIDNNSSKEIIINTFKSEILAATEPESTVDIREHWTHPNITIETDYNFGGMSSETILKSSVAWNMDPLYKTQVNYKRQTPCLLETYPKYGPAKEVPSGKRFSSFRTWELFHDSWDRERKGLESRRMMRTIAPWVTENPILMHVRSASDEAVKLAIDQCAEIGFEKVIMTFGSGFNAEDESDENILRIKNLVDYAHTKSVTLGGYSLLASRRVGGVNDVVMPEGKTPRFGNSPCIESEWGNEYFKKLYRLYEKTGLDNLEHDGSYPGDICISHDHPGHNGLDDSQWKQYKRITDFYKWCRSKGIYLNVPDYYFLSGSNKTGMGYRETNWSLPRDQQEIIERQNIYDGTWTKTPSMGWMFVPLVEYHGGGKKATIEPLKDHLPHYEQRLANLFGAGVQACYRGPQLYDALETKALVKKWVDFYKANRQILDGDIIHIRRPDGRDYDAILHVDPFGETKGMLIVYNPLSERIKRKIKVNLYYTGLKNSAVLSYINGKFEEVNINPKGEAFIEVEIPAKSQIWIKIH